MPSLVRLSDGTVVRPGVTPDLVPKVAHNVAAEEAAIDGGRMDGWQGVAGCGAKTGYACISGYPPAHVPNLAALAHKFAISDRTFSMADSPSWGGHLYAVMGSLDGFLGNNPIPARGVTPRPGWGCDSRHLTQWERPREQCSYDLDAPVSGPVEVEEEEQPPRQPAAGLVPGRGGSRYGVGFSTVSQ
jgi:hypothetical protein